MDLWPDTENCGLRMRRECQERFPRKRLQRKPLVIDPGMHNGMSGSLTRGVGENVPGIPGACATHIFTYLARGPLHKTIICQTAAAHDGMLVQYVYFGFRWRIGTGQAINYYLISWWHGSSMHIRVTQPQWYSWGWVTDICDLEQIVVYFCQVFWCPQYYSQTRLTINVVEKIPGVLSLVWFDWLIF